MVGTLARVLPLFDPQGRALRQFASEDGYLMLTIARNLAIGNGFSVENGETATNGTQPLMTLVYAGLFWLVGGDKVWGVVLVQALGLVVALAGAWLLYRIGASFLADDHDAAALAATAAAAWYVSPIATRYTQNCLETGTAAVIPMAVGLFFLRRHPGEQITRPLRQYAVLGALLGSCFWVRNDAVLLSAAVCLVLLLAEAKPDHVTRQRRFLEALITGLVALVVASPWLLFNYLKFGHVVPVSGISEGAGIPIGYNIEHLPSILVEQISIVALIPKALETTPIMLALQTSIVVLWVGGVIWYLSLIHI